METVVSLYKTPLIYGIMTMLFQFENGLEIQKTRIGAEVLRSGFYIDHTGDETPTTSQHSTVGFHRIGLPEIVVRGVSLDCAQQVLSGLYLAAQIGLAELTKGNHLEELFDREVHFTSVSPAVKKSDFLAARLYHGNWDFDVLEMCLGKTTKIQLAG